MAHATFTVPSECGQHVDIPLDAPHEFLRVGFRETRKCLGSRWDERDYVYVAHFTQWCIEYSYVLELNPFEYYVVDLGHGLILNPISRDGLRKFRCHHWDVAERCVWEIDGKLATQHVMVKDVIEQRAVKAA